MLFQILIAMMDRWMQTKGWNSVTLCRPGSSFRGAFHGCLGCRNTPSLRVHFVLLWFSQPATLCLCPFFLAVEAILSTDIAEKLGMILRFHVQFEKDRCRAWKCAIHSWHNVTLDCGDFMCPPKGSKTECIAGESWWFQRNLGRFTSSWNSHKLFDMLKTDACFELFWGASHTVIPVAFQILCVTLHLFKFLCTFMVYVFYMYIS